ncbi:regucalcin [Coniochaeta sp. PMI_546]|nr:regucalcin [Coniochaeta sp. PMI_546]
MPSQDIQHWSTGAPWIDLHCKLGEGPYYEPATNTLRFVDIIKKQLHTVSLAQGPDSLSTQTFDEAVTVTADIEGVDPQEKILVGAKQGIAVLDRRSGRYEYISKYADAGDANERIRSNDGAVDPHGRFWLGSMTDFPYGSPTDEGSLYLFTATKPATLQKPSLIIPNSIGWSPDHKTMYFTHSTPKQVIAWDYDADSGAISNERVFYQHPGPGSPDGFRVDTEGNLWHAVYGEGSVLKLSPRGELVGRIDLPTKNATCVEFVGTTLYITTANDDEGEGGSKSSLGIKHLG